jgi:hypothetical protein
MPILIENAIFAAIAVSVLAAVMSLPLRLGRAPSRSPRREARERRVAAGGHSRRDLRAQMRSSGA